MESWRKVWREGFLPQFNERQRTELRIALQSDDPRLTQGSTTTPPPLLCVQDWPVEAACAIGFAGWHGSDLKTVGEVEEFFAKACYEADQLLGEPAACRYWLNYWDAEPRGKVFAELLEELGRLEAY